ncbi:DUF1642 domain-containing protein [Enterococcus faecalis]|uniref:DUF1642 domain-containing protein n=1 Tax=Enterococcus faecalis TaxID=1351 RepID=UPI0019E6392D|nr:DUF1642 domain-containing protein [Enterococcus faecalis]EJE4048706.1 DUF1642 domain-containing protein [Enterococcus faecalis]
MNKQEKESLIQKLFDIGGNSDVRDEWSRGYENGVNAAIKVVQEYKTQEKIVVPKFAVEWLDKQRCSVDILQLFFNVINITDSGVITFERWGYSREFFNWLSDNADTLFTLCDAIQYGYEVEKEQLYYVKLPEIGYMRFGKKYFYSTNKEDAKRYTENQIKAIDERYWPFAVKVDGE